MRFARRFTATGVVVTLIDIAVVFVGVAATAWPLPLVDAIAVAIATCVSYALHRAISFAAEPARRWYRDLAHYLLAAGIALAVDVVLFAMLTASVDRTAGAVVVPKLLALVAAFLVRLISYRRMMFRDLREAQGRPAGRPDAPGELRLSLVVPAFREEDAIASTIARVEAGLGHLRADGGFELIVVDDGSPDETAARARSAGADVVIDQPRNSGKGAAVRAGMLAASGRTVAFTDADLSYSPEQVEGLMRQVEAGWDVVVGSRKHTETRTLVAARRLREVGGRVINALTSAVLLGQYRDTQCGLKAFRSDVARTIFARSVVDGFAFDIEVFHLVERFRFTLLEVPVDVVNSSTSTVHVVRDAGRLVRDLFRIRSVAHQGGYEPSSDDKVGFAAHD